MQSISTILCQVKLEGFEETAQLGPLFAILVSMVIILAATIVILHRQNEYKDKRLEKISKENADKIDSIRKEHADTINQINSTYNEKLESIRLEIMEKENQRNKEYRESEKETLHVLNGLSSILEMSEKMKVSDTKQILEKIKEIKELIEKNKPQFIN